MNETQPDNQRKPRSAARRARLEPTPRPYHVTPDDIPLPIQQPTDDLPLPIQQPTDDIPLPIQQPTDDIPLPIEQLPDVWEDTAMLDDLPDHKTFLSKQPPVFWVLAVALLIVLFSLVGIIGMNALHDAQERRAEERRLQQIAEEKARYKLLYRDLIEENASAQGIDPALVAAVIYNESRFDPNAVSNVGARGLMQIMEDTGDWIAYRLGEQSGYTFDSLFTPETNVRYGTWYLGYLSRLFEGDVTKILAGYHAGQNAVASWLENPEYSSDGSSLDTIPYSSTEQYVQRVVNAYEIYTRHYFSTEGTGTGG